MNLAKKRPLKYILCLAVFIFSSANGEIYKWVDDAGQIHFGDKQPEEAPSEILTPVVNSYQNVSIEIPDFDYQTGKKDNNVIMYATSRCGFCKKARDYFAKNDIQYTEYDIDTDKEARIRYDKLNATGVPVIFIGKTRMNGFSIKKFKRIYDFI